MGKLLRRWPVNRIIILIDAFLPAPLRSGRRQPGGARQLTACRYPASGGRPAPTLRRNRYSPEEFLHPLLGSRLLGYRRQSQTALWIGQEPDYDSPINLWVNCCKGAAVRDDVLSDRRLRYPQKLVDGQWKRLSWDQAIGENRR